MPQKIKTTLILFTLLILSFACGSKKTEYPPRSTKGEDGRIAYTSRPFKFGDEELRADYGTITVSENRNETASRFIHLPVIRIYARNTNSNPPIFCLAGGPGQSNVK